MWKTCVTLALLICVQVCAHGPLYPRIMGGANAQRPWPWMVSLHNPTRHFCGGSLISSQWVLSAAHCFVRDDYTKMDETSIRVYLGKMTQREVNNNEIVRFVQKRGMYTHSLYNATTDDNDIALLYLSSPVNFTDYISPLCLVAHGSDFPPRTSSRIIGWGQIAPRVNLAYPGTLQEAEVFVVNNAPCQTQLRQRNNRIQITPNMICAGVPGGGVGVYCVQQQDDYYSLLHTDNVYLNGDSGGPMMSQYCSKWVQSGITSWGIGCGLAHTPNVFTRVSQYQKWINDTIRGHPSQDLPQFVNVNLPCPPVTGPWGLILRCCSCFRG